MTVRELVRVLLGSVKDVFGLRPYVELCKGIQAQARTAKPKWSM